MYQFKLRPTLITSAIILLEIFGLGTVLIAQSSSINLRTAVESSGPLGLTVEQGLGKKLLFDYSIPEAGVEYRLYVTLRSNEVSWVEVKDGGRAETDFAQSVKLDDYRLMMNWFEDSGQFVVLYVDFKEGQTTYCGLLRPGVDKKGVCYTGTFTLTD